MDGVLIIAFGGPQGPQDVRPFLANVLRRRAVPPERVEQVARQYEQFGGRSPILEMTQRQAAGLQARLAERGFRLEVRVGMRHWHPYLSDVLAEMSRAGMRRVVGFIAAAHHSPASCGQYRQDVLSARRRLREAGLADVEVAWVDSWYDHPGFISAVASQARRALAGLDPSLASGARLVFTAHSLPEAMAAGCRYRQQLLISARLTAEALDRPDWVLVFQSRSGRPEDPWLGPDVKQYLREARSAGLPAAVIVPIGFLCDHMEVVHDLDVAAAAVCREVGLPMVRAGTVGLEPAFMDMMAELVERVVVRHRRFGLLPIAPRW